MNVKNFLRWCAWIAVIAAFLTGNRGYAKDSPPDLVYISCKGILRGPYPVTVEDYHPLSGVSYLRFADDLGAEDVGRIFMERRSTWLAIRHQGKLYVARNIPEATGSGIRHLAVIIGSCVGSFPKERDRAEFQRYLPHVTWDIYAGYPLMKLPASGLGLNELSQELARRGQHALILAPVIPPTDMRATHARVAMGYEGTFRLDTWEAKVALRDHRVAYVFECPVSRGLIGGNTVSRKAMVTIYQPSGAPITFWVRPGSVHMLAYDDHDGTFRSTEANLIAGKDR